MSEAISVVIPVYNAANWLKPTIEHIVAALDQAGLKKTDAEIIIVNDGSTDDTSKVAHELSATYPTLVIDQANNGRFMTRKAGLMASKYDNILFVDSRVFIHPKSLDFIFKQIKEDASKVVWNGHVIVDKKGNIIARFGDAITFIGWRRYFKNPRTCSYGLDDFDHYPKGTGYFFAPRSVLIDAVKTFESQTYDIKNSSDDTHLIRLIAAKYRINLSPSFSCIYHSRSKLKQFITHSHSRGRTFVDGFLRPGNRFYYPLLVFLIGSVVMLSAIIIFPSIFLAVLKLATVLWIFELITALALRVNVKDALSLFILSPLFAIFYGLGIWRAVFAKIVKNRSKD